MAAAGYDVGQGDTWALNEAGSAIRRGEGTARADLREFVRGLYEGGGRPARGVVFVIGLGQRTADVSVYQATVQSWLTDTTFWTDMAAYVSDWSQQVYGDVRSYAVPGAPKETRRDLMNDYLQHVSLLAGAGPPEIEAARAYLGGAYSPLANAAWQRDAGYGWTMVPVEQMASYVSAQVYALRSFSATSGQALDRWGFAWAPRNGTGAPAAEFAAQAGAVLDRLAAAIRDSGSPVDPEDPGSEACGPPGQNTWCVGDLPDARPAEAWRSFRTWSQPLLRFTSAPQTLTAGAPSAELALALVTATGLPAPARAPLAITLSSSSTSGGYSTIATGPWSPTLVLTLPAGASTLAGVYYLDTLAGAHTLTASAAGATSATQPVTVTPAPVARVVITPGAAIVRARASRRFAATATDAFGNAVAATFRWSVSPAALGMVRAASARAATFIAARTLGAGRMLALVDTAAGPISAEAAVTVTPSQLRIGISTRKTRAGLLATLQARDGAGRPVPGAIVVLAVRRDGGPTSRRRAATGPAGRAALGLPARRGTCWSLGVARAFAPGFAWDGRARRSRVCR
jgi:hypothetical protein